MALLAKRGEALDLAFELPPGWVELPGLSGPREYRPRVDGSRGRLQVSRLADEHLELIAQQEDLGAFAEEMGMRSSTQGQNWGNPTASIQGTCAMGRVGFAVFRDGAFPSMFVWVTVSKEAALLWTWRGPDSTAPEVEEVVRIVLGARLRA